MSKTTRSWLVLILALTLVRGLIYVAVIPPWQSPDEPKHFLFANWAAVEHDENDAVWSNVVSEAVASWLEFRLWDWMHLKSGVGGQEAVAWRFAHETQNAERATRSRSLVYNFLVPLLDLTRSQGPTFQLYLIRCLSVLANVGVVAAAYAIASLLFKDDKFFQVLLPLSIVFLPQHTFIMASVNDGNPAELFASVAIVGMVWGVVKGFRWYTIFLVIVATLLGIASKPTAYFLLPGLGIFFILFTLQTRHRWQGLLILPALGALAIGGVLASSRFHRYLFSIWRGSFVKIGADTSLEGVQTILFSGDLLTAFGGFWAGLGWYTLFPSDAWIWVWLFVTLLGIVGFVLWMLRIFRRTPRKDSDLERSRILVMSLFGLLVIANGVLILVASIARGSTLHLMSRYLYGAIIPIMALLVMGWRELIPARWRAEGLAALFSLFFLFDAAVLLNYAVPFFYPLWQ